MDVEILQPIVEAVLFAAGEPLTLDRLRQLFPEEGRPTVAQLREVIQALQVVYAERPTELKELASGFCFQVRPHYAPWVGRLWEEKPPRFSRALLETLALIAYRQPITRAEIEEIRGVSVSPTIMKSLLEREWIQVVGHKEVPGRPALFATAKAFLDHFNLKGLDELPELAPILQDIPEQVEQNIAEEVDFPQENQ